jgi:hypothetical protein
MNSAEIYAQVQERYGAAARSAGIKYGETVAKTFGYSEEELAAIPKEANLGLSCGNPLAIASIREVSTLTAVIHALTQSLGRDSSGFRKRCRLRCLSCCEESWREG